MPVVPNKPRHDTGAALAYNPAVLTSARTRASVVADIQPTRASEFPIETLAIVALTVAGAALRFATISSQSYWFDEASTVHETHLSLGALLHVTHVSESTPPLYFVLAWLWAKVFGAGEVGLRSLSALAGVAAIPITYACGRELASRRAGLAAAAIAAVSPFMIWYSQEARAYMLFGAFCGASFLFFARALRRATRRDLTWWAVFSALALTTHFFAGFLVAPEALWLLYAVRSRASMFASLAVGVVQLAMLPLALSDASHNLSWIQAFPLSTRLQQIPVNLGLGNLYRSSIVTHGLLGAAAIAGIVIVLLIIGADREELEGAGIAAMAAACVLLVPVGLALLGSDYVVPRNFMPAWIPLAVVVGAACTASRTRVAGALLLVVVLGGSVWALIRVADHAQYRKPDWRGVAAALGASTRQRAIVVYAGAFGTAPLTTYLRGVPWTGPALNNPQPSLAPVTVGEVDVVGNVGQSVPGQPPAGARLIATRRVAGYLVVRYLVSPAWHGSRPAIGVRAATLLGPAPAGAGVLIQSPA
jgi:mannosyltransferase